MLETVPLKAVAKAGAAAVVILVLFFVAAAGIGRDTASKGLVDYITLYGGGSIKNLDSYLKDENPPKPVVRGGETFPSLLKDLRKFGLIDFKDFTNHLEFRHAKNGTTGNVYTTYRRWINDFGYVGMAILQGGMALFFAVAYNVLRMFRGVKRMWYDLLMILYAYLAYTLWTHSIDGLFYNSFMAIGFVVIVVIAVAEYWWLVGKERVKK